VRIERQAERSSLNEHFSYGTPAALAGTRRGCLLLWQQYASFGIFSANGETSLMSEK
jgi:hypothetical protein